MQKNRFRFILQILITIIALSFVINISILYFKNKYNQKIKEYISNELKFSPETIDGELEQLTEWTSSFWSTEENRGLLYERIANIYLWKGDSLEYYSSIGSALYYLERSENYNTLVNLYADLANFYIMNAEMDLAQEQLTIVDEIMETREETVNNQMKSYLKRLEAMICSENREYITALRLLEESDSFVDDKESWGPAYLTINEINKARNYLAIGDLESSERSLKACEESGLLDIGVYVAIFNRDLILPYYQVKAVYDLQTKGEEVAKEDLNKLMDLASDGGWQVCALDTLIYLKSMDVSEKFGNYILENIQQLYVSLANVQTKNYVNLTSSQVQLSKENALRENNQKISLMRRWLLGSVLFIFVSAVLFIMYKIIKANYTDGLTKISNRKYLDKRLARMKKTGERFVFVMIDIDNFKKINDTYGHEAGDKVLKELGKLLLDKYSNSNLHCFRYGGEEFAIIIKNCPVDGAVVITDSIRQAFCGMEWTFKPGLRITLSAGVAGSDGCEDVVKAADDNLYKAKKNGKNQVCAG